jgi:hypothetical protein
MVSVETDVDDQIASFLFCLPVSVGRMLGRPYLDLACIMSVLLDLHTRIIGRPEDRALIVLHTCNTSRIGVPSPARQKSFQYIVAFAITGSSGWVSCIQSPCSPVPCNAFLRSVSGNAMSWYQTVFFPLAREVRLATNEQAVSQ